MAQPGTNPFNCYWYDWDEGLIKSMIKTKLPINQEVLITYTVYDYILFRERISQQFIGIVNWI